MLVLLVVTSHGPCVAVAVAAPAIVYPAQFVPHTVTTSCPGPNSATPAFINDDALVDIVVLCTGSVPQRLDWYENLGT